MKQKELIKFLNYLEENELFTDDLSDESKENIVLNFIHSAQGENSNVSDNETKEKKCHWNWPEFRSPCYCSTIKCKDCNY